MKHIHLLVVLLMVSTIIAGCGSSPAATPSIQPPAASAAVSPPTPAAAPTTTLASAPSSASAAPVTLRVFALEQPGIHLATNTFSKEMEQRFNIRFQWQSAPWDPATSKQKRDLSLASGDYPDLYLVHWRDTFLQLEVLQYAQQGIFLPLNNLIDQYAPHIKAALAQYPTFKAQATAPDGQIYGLPQINDCYHCSYPNKLWINTTWLKKLGLSMPTTPEEFKAVLQAFKTRDPNGNGKADEMPLSGSTQHIGTLIIPYLMNSFIYDDNHTYLVINTKTVDFAANKPGWKAGLAYIKSLYDAGLIDPNAFTQKGDALQKLASNPDGAVIGACTALHPADFVPLESPLHKEYDAVPPLRGPHQYAVYNPGEQGAAFVLTSKASPQAQVAAIKMLDYLFTTEGQIRGFFGEEGVDWRKPQPGEIALNPKVTPLYVNTSAQNAGGQAANHAWGPIAQYSNPREYRDAEVQTTDIYSVAGFERRLQQATDLYESKQPTSVFPHWAIWIDPAQADEATLLRTSINEYVDQNALLFITGAKDLDKDWDAYVAGLDQLKLKRYLALMQQAYDRAARP